MPLVIFILKSTFYTSPVKFQEPIAPVRVLLTFAKCNLTRPGIDSRG